MCHKHDTTTNMSQSQNVLSSCLDSSNFLANLVIRLHFTPRSRIIPLVPSMPVALTNCMGISPSVLCSHVLFQFTGLWSHHILPQMSDRPCVTPWMALPHYILLRASSAGHFFYNSYRWPQYFCTLLLLFLLLWLCCPTHQLSFSQLWELTRLPRFLSMGAPSIWSFPVPWTILLQVNDSFRSPKVQFVLNPYLPWSPSSRSIIFFVQLWPPP